MEAMNVPRMAKVTIAPKFAKNGFCKNMLLGEVAR
jgi:hypothetical protein